MVGRTVGTALAAGRTRLRLAGVPNEGLDAALLLAHQLGWERPQLLAHPDHALPEADASAYAEMIQRRAAGEPLAYLTGHREFMGLDLLVDRRVLVPRPETEHLVALALDRLRKLTTERLVAVDVGTGSGAIAVSLAVNMPELTVIASDIDAGTLAVARANALRQGVIDRIHLVRGSLLGWLGGPVDLIAANLPYLRPDQANPTIAYEPPTALYAGEDGFELYRQLMAEAPARLRPGGRLLIEIDPGQTELARDTALAVAPDWRVTIFEDYAGHNRVFVLDWPAAEI